MVTQPLHGVLQQLRKVAAEQTDRELSDRELLNRFLAVRDESAFTVLIERHGPMVLGVCRRSLSNLHDAEDACQATFLVLARRAASVRQTTSLGNWLHGVACRVAANLKRVHARRKTREREIGAKPQADPVAEVTWREMQTILDEALQQLPERYRTPMILCYLECMTRDEAAQQLGLSLTTLHGRLEHARRLLRHSLSKRGLTLSAAMSAILLAESVAQAALPPTLVVSSTRAAMLLATGQRVTEGVVANQVLALTQEVIKSMFLTKLKLCMATVLCAGLIVALIGGALTSLDAQDTKRIEAPRVEERANVSQKQGEEKKPFTAWGKEIGGLQAGLGFRPGEQRAYELGETVTLVVRIRNVGKEAVKFEYVRQYLDEEAPVVTDADGKTFDQHRISVLGFHVPVHVSLEPGQQVELETRMDGAMAVRHQLLAVKSTERKSADGKRPGRPLFVGAGKLSVHYDRVLGDSSAGKINLDPALSHERSFRAVPG
jgi:RNA polymerase sigma factor (sigma-70 family)